MKKIFMLFAGALIVLICGTTIEKAIAQETGTAGMYISADADACPNIHSQSIYQHGQSKAMWDVLFNYNITAAANGSVGCAGVCYINGDIWISKWQSDSLMRFTTGGVLIEKFFIAGLSGVRSLTSDGTYLYAGTNTTTIYRINPTTKLLSPPHITVANNARWVTYDPTLNGNAGGFWYGNFTTDITAVDMSGNVLSSIPAATHGLTGMYGAAYDGASAGGPYLWIFDQSGTNTTQVIAVSIATGTPTVYTRDAFADVGPANSLTSGLAGGMFLSTTISPGNIALIGVVQGTPNNVVFAYDLDIVAGLNDAAVSDLRPVAGYTQIPVKQIFPESFTFTMSNQGSTSLDSVYADVTISHNGTPVFTDQVITTNLASAATFNATAGPYTPSDGPGTYVVDVLVYPGSSQADADASNDTVSFTFYVTDSVFARDNGIPDGGSGYAISGTDWAYALTSYTLAVDDTLQGIWIQLATPVNGDTTFAVVAHATGGIPDAVFATGDTTIIDSTLNEYYLEFATPLPLPAGLYFFGCYEGGAATINLAQSPELFTAGMNYFYTPTGSWTQSGIQTARFIRPYFKLEDNSSGIGHLADVKGLKVYPNPSAGVFTLALPEGSASDALIKVFDASGRLISDFSVSGTSAFTQIDLSTYPEGLYLLQISDGDNGFIQKIMISR